MEWAVWTTSSDSEDAMTQEINEDEGSPSNRDQQYSIYGAGEQSSTKDAQGYVGLTFVKEVAATRNSWDSMDQAKAEAGKKPSDKDNQDLIHFEKQQGIKLSAPDSMGSTCMVNISAGAGIPDCEHENIPMRMINEEEDEEQVLVTQEDLGESSEELEFDSSNSTNEVRQKLNPGRSDIQRKKRNLTEDGLGQASKLVKRLELPQENQMPCSECGKSASGPSCSQWNETSDPSCYQWNETSDPSCSQWNETSDPSCSQWNETSDPSCSQWNETSDPSCSQWNETSDPSCSQWNETSDPSCSQWNETSDPSCSQWNETSDPSCSQWNETSDPSCSQWNETSDPSCSQRNETSDPSCSQWNETSDPSCSQWNETSDPSCSQWNETSDPSCSQWNETFQSMHLGGNITASEPVNCMEMWSHSSEWAANQEVHTEKWKSHCAECNITCRNVVHLNRHRLINHQIVTPKPYKCPECNKCFVTAKAMSKHWLKRHNVEKPYQCRECNLRFSSIFFRNQHHHTAHKIEKFIKCPECNNCFVTANAMSKHWLKLHNVEKPYQCRVCNFRFSSIFFRNQHHHTAHKTEKFIKCPECKNCFVTANAMSKHWLRFHNHNVEELFQCTVCNLTFNSFLFLKKHRRKVHKTERLIKCPECNKRFVTEGDMSEHRHVMHSVEKPYQCTECNLTFNSSLLRYQHHHTVHGTEKCFKCPECKEHFPSKRRLNKHLLHTVHF